VPHVFVAAGSRAAWHCKWHFPGRESHPLKVPGLSWRTEEATNVRIEYPVHSFSLDAHGQGV
jgi:hypothetical protein